MLFIQKKQKNGEKDEGKIQKRRKKNRTLASPNLLPFGKTQINLVILSLNRNFAPRKEQDEYDNITSDTSDAGAELPGLDAECGCV